MHAVRRSLLETQAERLDLPLHIVEIPSPCPNEEYEARMAAAVSAARDEHVERMVFGDLFLEDVARLPGTEPGRHRHHAGVSTLRSAH